MKNESNKENLENQGRGLRRFFKILCVILVILLLLLIDQTFVPWGNTWEEMKSVADSEEIGGLDDPTIWRMAKDVMVEEDVVPIKSGFLCWGVCLRIWNREKARNAEFEETIRKGRADAETVMTVVNEFLAENGIDTADHKDPEIYPPYVTFELNIRHSYSSWASYYFLDERERGELEEKLRAAFPDRYFSAVAVVLGERCTAAVFSEDVDLLGCGSNYPYLDENGYFDTEEIWGWGYHEKGDVGYVDEIMLAESAEESEARTYYYHVPDAFSPLDWLEWIDSEP
ncbi:MAG: hypothetical protein NC084_06670 [Bacteroides sp.]|nr:hypothetical protein [Eubacterium sp.]MCM1418236.1 hypothetical protein [Roseburia sp.]MCM1462382.1 hypothetical protein [Bacteroides sp.]